MGKIRRYTCSAKNCRSVYSYAEGGVQMLTFPKDLHRCRVWVQNSGNAVLLKQPKNKLHKLRYLCKAHFADNQFLNKYKTRLSKMAIPTIFSEPPLSDKQMEQFEVTDDEEVKLPLDQVFRSVTRHIDIPAANPLSHVVIEVSDLPGRVSRVRQTSVTPSVSPVLRTRDVYETEAIEAEAIDAEVIEAEAVDAEAIDAEVIEAEAIEAEAIEAEAIEAEAPSSLEVMDHTYATSGSSGDNVDCDVLMHGSDEEAVLPTVSSTPDPAQRGTRTVLRKLASGDISNSSINMELYKELIKMEKKVQDLQQEVDRLKAATKGQNSEVESTLESDLDLVHLIDVDLRGNRRKKVDESGCELNEELIALAIFRC